MQKAAIFSIGEELLEGSVIDSNSAHIASNLLKSGIEVIHTEFLPDNEEIIANVLKDALGKYNIILTTGGLGPTFDDLTAVSVAKACGVRAVLNEEAFAHIDKLRRTPLNEGHKHQATLPEGAVLMPNNHGTAMGFITPSPDKKSWIFSMPGVPYEMYPMLRDSAIPFIKERFNINPPFIRNLRFIGVPESIVDAAIIEHGIPEGVKCIINAGKGEVIVKIRDEKKDKGAEFAEKVKNSLEKFFFTDSDKPLAALVIDELNRNNLKISVAESCTGGLLGAEFTSVSGSSSAFYGGVISYDNSVKIKQLGVTESILKNHGAVSEECAVAMAEGVKKLIGTECSISVTGIAGPDGGSADKPVGTVFITIIVNDKKITFPNKFRGEREAVRLMAVKISLIEMYKLLRSVETERK